MDKEIAQILNQEGFTTARGCRFQGENVWLLRNRWGIATVKINGVAANPMRWSDGSYSVQGVASLLGVTPQRSSSIIWPVGFLIGRQLVKGQPWQIDPTDDQIRVSAESFATHQTIKKGGIMRSSRRRSCHTSDPREFDL